MLYGVLAVVGGLVHERKIKIKGVLAGRAEIKGWGEKIKSREQCSGAVPHPRQPSDTKPHPSQRPPAVGRLGRRQVAGPLAGMRCVLSRLTGMGNRSGGV
ncbi:hypothetical protein GCM10010452_78730 [Crossiella cryophila]